MPSVRKTPYYTMDAPLFRPRTWREHCGAAGAVPIDTPQTISYARRAPGEGSAPLPLQSAKPTAEQLAQLRLDTARQKAADEQARGTAKRSAATVEASSPRAAVAVVELDAEPQEKLPEFDLQDIPGAMDKIGWPVSAKLARRWFASSKHVYNDDANSVQPFDDTLVTLRWALRYGSLKRRFDELVDEKVATPNAVREIKKKLAAALRARFGDEKSTRLDLDTSGELGDLRQFHNTWEFQYNAVSTFDTLDGLLMTDLSGALGNFNLYAAIGRVAVQAERYFEYTTADKTKTYCADATAIVTHVYVYIKDNYSFNDKKGSSKSQYLGHWNKRDMILSYTAAASDLVNTDKINSQPSNIEKESINWDYLLHQSEVAKPVDTRNGFFKKLLARDVYFPVYNRSYNEWREARGRGGDFMVYSKPELIKLKKPIRIKLDTQCRPPEPM